MLRTERSAETRFVLIPRHWEAIQLLGRGSPEVRFLLSKDLSSCRKGMHWLGRWKTRSRKWLLTSLRQGPQDERRGQPDKYKDGEQAELGD